MSYTTATPFRADRNADGRCALWTRYTGDTGEPAIEEAIITDYTDPTPLVSIRKTAYNRIAALNGNKALLDQAPPLLGVPLDLVTPFPSPAPSTYGAFMACSTPFTPGSTPQDVFTITGSATRKVTVTRMSLASVQTTAGMLAWSLIKRSTANSGGTSVAMTAVPTDRGFPAATATVLRYTGNPTLGNAVGPVWSGRIASPAPATAPVGDLERVVLSERNPITLDGTGDVLAWSLAGIALPAGLSVQATVWWNEN